MGRLIDMLNANEKFKSLPDSKREIFLKLADVFEDNDLALYLTPSDLSMKLQIGSKANWTDFLNLEPVDAYIKSEMALNAKIAQRQAVQSMTKEAARGDASAARIINDISGVLNSGDRNKIVVLHRVNRPKEVEPHEAVSPEA